MGTKKSCVEMLTDRLALKRSALRGFFDMICWGVLKAIGLFFQFPSFLAVKKVSRYSVVSPFWLSMSFSTVYFPCIYKCLVVFRGYA